MVGLQDVRPPNGNAAASRQICYLLHRGLPLVFRCGKCRSHGVLNTLQEPRLP
jgi:hypothetical protein